MREQHTIRHCGSALALGAALAVPGAAILGAAFTPAAQAQAQEEGREYDIPAGPLSEVLTQFAAEAELLLSGEAALTDERESPGLQGTYTVEEALERVLRDSGIAYQRQGQTVTLSRTDDGDTNGAGLQRLDPIMVAAPSDYVAEESYAPLKSPLPVLRTPQDVSVITESVIREQDPDELQDLYRNTAGIQDSSLNRDFVIRGFRSNSNSSILFDGQRGLPGTFRYHPKAFSTERVEVLKGPSSLLFGTLVPGGVVNIVPKGPERERTNRVSSKFGEFDELYASGQHTGILPGTESLSYRFDWRVGGNESFVENIDEERLILAPSLRWDIDPYQSLTFIGRIVDEDQNGRRRRGVPDVEGEFFALPESYTVNEPTDFVDHDVYWLNTKYENALPRFDGVRWRSSLRVSYSETEEEYHEPRTQPAFEDDEVERQFRDSTNETLSLYHDTHFTFDFGDVDGAGFSQKVRAGFDLYYEEGESTQAVRWQEGLVFDESIRDVLGFVPKPGVVPSINAFSPQFRQPPGPQRYNPEEITNTRSKQRLAGLYLQDVIEWRRWTAVAGVRFDYFDEELERRDRRPQPDQEFSDEAVNFRGGLLYELIPGQTVYASYSESFEPQSLGVQSDLNGPFDPEEAYQVELGHKARWLDGRLQSTVSAYRIVKENVVRDDPDDPTRSVAIGEVRSRGVEVELRGRVTRNIDVAANYAYVDAEIRKPGGSGIAVGQPPWIQADQTAGLWARYRFPATAFWVAAGAEWSNSFENDDPDATTPGSFVVFDAAVGLRPTENVELQLNVDNVADERFVRGGFGGSSGWEPGGPRRISLQASLDF